METLKFKTNIKCGGCITTVTPFLNALPGLEKWEVDTAQPEKILTVSGNGDQLAAAVISALDKAGFKGETA